MFKNSKKVFSLLVAIVMTIVVAVPVYAEPSTDVFIGEVIPEYYTYTSHVGAGFHVNSEGKGVCTGDFELYSSRTVTICVSLMKSSSGSGWYTADSWSKTVNSDSSILTGKATLDHGYYYCTYTQIYVYDASGNLLESPGGFSGVTYYA